LSVVPADETVANETRPFPERSGAARTEPWPRARWWMWSTSMCSS